MKTLLTTAAFLLWMLSPALTFGQTRVLHAVVGGGGTAMSDGGGSGVIVTIGQPAIALPGGVQAGFWPAAAEAFVRTSSEPPAPENALPLRFALGQNYPNPFSHLTTVPYDVPRAAHVRMEVFDVLGRRVATLADGVHAAGSHRVSLTQRNWPGGLYFVRMQAGSDFSGVRRIVLIR